MSLTVLHIDQYYGKKQILKSVSFQAPQKTVVALLGPNGAGKTTLLRTVVGLQNLPSQSNAEIILNDQTVTKWPLAKKVSHGLVYVPQQTSLFLSLTVLENLLLVYEYNDYWQNVPKEHAHSRSKEVFEKEMHRWLERTSLTHALKQPAGTLSGGQKRKLEIIRALLLHPSVIMFDEPFAGVDPKSIYELKDMFLELASQGMSIVISDHHVDQLLSIATIIYVVVNGEVVVHGGIQDIMENEYTKNMYLGHQFHSEMLKRYLK